MEASQPSLMKFLNMKLSLAIVSLQPVKGACLAKRSTCDAQQHVIHSLPSVLLLAFDRMSVLHTVSQE